MKIESFFGLSEEGFHRIVYSEWGESHPETPTIICVHGLTRNRRDFDAFANYLSSQGRHVFCPDIVGRGDSDYLKNPLHYTYEQYIADMNAMIARTNSKEKIDWIGTSMGGLIGMFIASLPRNPLRRLIINDIGPQIPAAAMTRMSTYTGTDPEFASLDEAKRYFKNVYSGFGTLTEDNWQHFTETSVREVATGKWVTKIDPGVKIMPAKSKLAWKSLLHPLKALEGSLFDIDLWEVWRKITCPVLVIHGKHSDLLLPQTIEKMIAIHPNTEVIEIEDAGHAPALFDPSHHHMIFNWLKSE